MLEKFFETGQIAIKNPDGTIIDFKTMLLANLRALKQIQIEQKMGKVEIDHPLIAGLLKRDEGEWTLDQLIGHIEDEDKDGREILAKFQEWVLSEIYNRG